MYAMDIGYLIKWYVCNIFQYIYFLESHIVRIFSRAQVHSIISYNGLNNLFCFFVLIGVLGGKIGVRVG